ncbi:Alpha/beta hydrolase [Sphingopyxis sp. LC81]|nr:Alpha/beta hydrolase [Sphingopyxis sp. LC81]
MRGKVISIVLVVLVSVIAVGYMSGRQPDRDAVAAASKEFDTAFRGMFVDANGVRLHVVIAGPEDGKPILLLHGYPEFWYAWRGVMADLARKGYRVIALDQRGYNRSAKPSGAHSYRLNILAKDIVEVAAALGHERFALVGHDFGGQVTWWTSLLHPKKVVGALVVNKPHPYAIRDVRPEEEAISWYRTFLRVPWLPGHIARYGNWGLLEKNLQDTSEPGTFSKEVMDQYKAAWDRDGSIHSMGAWYRANATFDADVGAGLVTVPARLLLAKNDAFSPPELAFASERYLEKGDVRELHIGTHWVIQEHPRLIADEIDKFVGGLEWTSGR